MHKHSALLFSIVFVFICEKLTAPATVICLTGCNIINTYQVNFESYMLLIQIDYTQLNFHPDTSTMVRQIYTMKIHTYM